MIVLIGMLLLSACGGKKYAALPIDEKVDVCAICKMQVKDGEFATQLFTKDGKNYKFDDIGCMHKWVKENGADQVSVEYVRDYKSKEWIEYDKASYVYDKSIRTPMAYGIVSFKDADSAKDYVAEQKVGTVLTATELDSHEWKQNKDMMKMGSGMKDGQMKGDNGMKASGN